MLVAIAIACWVAALVPVVRDRDGADRRPLVIATVIALGIPAQAVIGGITVHTDLNPWVVALHLLVSMAIISACVLLLDRLVGRPRSWALALDPPCRTGDVRWSGGSSSTSAPW